MRKAAMLTTILAATLLAGCNDTPQTPPAASASETLAEQQSKAQRELYLREKRVVEEAPWFGKTGLGPTVEREVPRYVRHELGQVIFDKDSLKAADLEYRGAYVEHGNHVYTWQFKPTGTTHKRYAYVRVSHTGEVAMSVSSKAPRAEKR
jgi:hypothetical protein